MGKREIRRAAVIGAGVMGSTIAAHLANVGIPVYLLDIVPSQLTPEEEAKGLTLESPPVRNRLAEAGKAALLKAKPAPLYTPRGADLITTGNLQDNLDWLKKVDWTIEVIVENMAIKKQLYKNIEAYWKPGSIVSSNTSGLSINEMVSDCSLDYRKHFLGTHFFNPPRYMKLLEVIPCKDTDQEVLDFMFRFGERVLGKGVVLAKDTVNFIGNRVGTYAMMVTINEMLKGGYTIEEVDAVTGPPMGHPKSASFRTLDLVGIDTFYHVANNVREHAADEDEKQAFTMPEFLAKMVENKWLGDKTRQGFYKKVKTDKGKEILTLDYNTMEYRTKEKPDLPILKETKKAGLEEGMRLLIAADDRIGKLAWNVLKKTLLYSARRIPEIADDIVNVDRAMRWGFNWKLGPFESWDKLGVRETVARMKQEGEEIPLLVQALLDSGKETFYQQEGSNYYFFDLKTKDYQPVIVSPEIISLPNLKEQGAVVKSNSHGSLVDLGDGVLCLEMHSPNQAITDEFVEMMYAGVEEAESNYKGLIVGNQAKNFCVGANLFMVLMAARQNKWDMLEKVVKEFQYACMALKYSRVPVVAAPFGMTLGGGMEITLGCDRVQAAAETYMGQVEVGVGLIPGGGGNKEVLIRYMEGIPDNVTPDYLPFVQKAFEALAMGTVATSARHAQDLRFLRPTDKVTVNQDFLLYDAKQTLLAMVQEGYEQPRQKLIPVTGEYGYSALVTATDGMLKAGYISAHDKLIADKIAYCITGGKIAAGSKVSEEYLLEIEREAFLSLCGEEKSQARMQHMLQNGKPLRN